MREVRFTEFEMKLNKDPASRSVVAEESWRIREVAGQRTLHSTGLHHRRDSGSDSKSGSISARDLKPMPRSSTKQSLMSLSDYLTRKLHTASNYNPNTNTSFPPPLPLEKKSIMSPASTGPGHTSISIFAGSGRSHPGVGEGRDKEKALVIEDSVFKQFCPAPALQANDSTLGVGELERKNPFAAGAQKKHLLIIGEDPNPRHKTCKWGRFTSTKKPRHLFNHYESGSGWWNSEREGVDHDEVGCNEVWEGMASTTLGELQWH